ncbi:PRA1 family protein-domain-containing protein [Infundibulicybe gibba]|nr:PRA1 family protein-domain-containing protein [Infundibulicybe gibba]
MEAVMRATEALKNFRETKLANLRPPQEFFDFHRISRPANLNQATERISYNTGYFSGNYGLIVAALAVYAVLTNYILLIALAFIVCGYIAIGKFITEPVQFGQTTVTPRHLYITLFVIGIPLLYVASPIWTFFWFVGASAVLIIGTRASSSPESKASTLRSRRESRPPPCGAGLAICPYATFRCACGMDGFWMRGTVLLDR